MDGIEMAGMEENEGAFAEEDVTKEDTRESCANMEEGGEADGGYSSNSCNGGEDGVDDCEDGEEGAVDGIDDTDVRGENVEEGENGWEENCNEEQDGSQEDYDPFNAVEEAADAEPTSNSLKGLNGHEESEAFFENASEVMLGHSDLDDTLAGLSESNKNFGNNTLDDADEQKEQSEDDEPAEPHEEAEHEEQSEHDERADNDEQAAAANSTDMLGANMMDMTENINPNDHNAGGSNSRDHIGENEDGGDETGDTDADGEMSIKIGSVSSIQTVVHEDLSRWGAKLEAEGDNDEEVWENGTEKEINGQKDKEAADTEEEDIEYDNAILKAMQESIVENNDKGEKEKGTEDDSREDELTLDGVPEVAETVGFTDDEVEDNEIGEANPFDDIDPYVETEEDFFKAGADVGYDPLNDGGDDIGTDENTSGFLDQVNSGALPMVVDLPKQVRGPYKKKRSYGDDDSGEDSDEYIPFDDEPGRKEPRKAGKSATSVDPNDKNAVIFKCLVCSFPFDTLGQMKIHKYADHENEEKPSYLDLIEAAIMAKKNRKTGVSKNLLLQVITDYLSEYKSIILFAQEAMREPSVTDPKTKAVYLLSKALKAGLARGRLMVAKHQPKNGGQNYRLASKPNRKKVSLDIICLVALLTSGTCKVAEEQKGC